MGGGAGSPAPRSVLAINVASSSAATVAHDTRADVREADSEPLRLMSSSDILRLWEENREPTAARVLLAAFLPAGEAFGPALASLTLLASGSRRVPSVDAAAGGMAASIR